MKKKIESIKNAKFNECEAINGGATMPMPQSFSIETGDNSDIIMYFYWTHGININLIDHVSN